MSSFISVILFFSISVYRTDIANVLWLEVWRNSSQLPRTISRALICGINTARRVSTQQKLSMFSNHPCFVMYIYVKIEKNSVLSIVEKHV